MRSGHPAPQSVDGTPTCSRRRRRRCAGGMLTRSVPSAPPPSVSGDRRPGPRDLSRRRASARRGRHRFAVPARSPTLLKRRGPPSRAGEGQGEGCAAATKSAARTRVDGARDPATPPPRPPRGAGARRALPPTSVAEPDMRGSEPERERRRPPRPSASAPPVDAGTLCRDHGETPVRNINFDVLG